MKRGVLLLRAWLAGRSSGVNMQGLTDDELHEGVSVDLLFRGDRPAFGDLFTVCGFENPNFPPESAMFANLGDLGIEQVDDFFGIRSDSDEGADVLLWLMPLINGAEVHHEQGPFDGVRLQFNVLRHPEHRAARFIDVAERMATHLDVDVRFSPRRQLVPIPALRSALQAHVERIQAHWRGQGIQCGSTDALTIDW